MSTRKLCAISTLFCCALAAVCLSIYHGVAYTAVASTAMGLSLLILIAANFKKLRNEFSKIILCVAEFLILCVTCDMLMFGLYNLTDSFVWWAFGIIIGTEFVSLTAGFLIIKPLVRRVMNQGNAAPEYGIILIWSIIGNVTASILMHIFNPSDNIIAFILISIICIVVCLFMLPVPIQIYRAYLIKKYRITCENPL